MATNSGAKVRVQDDSSTMSADDLINHGSPFYICSHRSSQCCHSISSSNAHVPTVLEMVPCFGAPAPHVLMPLELCNASARRLSIATLIHAARFDGQRLSIAKRRQSATARQSRQSLGNQLTGYLPRDLLGCRPRKQNHLTDFIFLVRLLLSRSKINFRMLSHQLVSYPYLIALAPIVR